ncbi:13318_t:CDS:1, partial [Ambispora gerdemannii]
NDSSKISRASPQPKPANDSKTCSSKDYKQAEYKYYLPYVVSYVVIGVGAIFWYYLYELACRIVMRPPQNNEIPLEATMTSSSLKENL